jgi:Zn-dependent protease
LIRQHLHDLDKAASDASGSDNKWVKKLGPLGPVAALLAKGKAVLLAIFKLKSLLSLLTFLWIYCVLFGYKFGIGFAAMIMIHEMGHFVDVKLRGLPADLPVFLPGLGAYVRWDAMGVSTETRAGVSLAGPLAGWIAAAVCALVWVKTGNALWAALARAGAWLNVLNLIPVWMLDGGQAVTALGKASRLLLLTASLALWLFLGENVFFLVAAGAAWRLFTKDVPEQSSVKITAYYLAVLGGLALVMRLMPGHGFTAQ